MACYKSTPHAGAPASEASCAGSAAAAGLVDVVSACKHKRYFRKVQGWHLGTSKTKPQLDTVEQYAAACASDVP